MFQDFYPITHQTHVPNTPSHAYPNFSALEKSQIDAERETPIDRWMGWSVKTEEEQQAAAAGKFEERNMAVR